MKVVNEWLEEEYKKGKKEGKEEGKIEGKEEEKLKMAKNMKLKNYPIHEIIEITQLNKQTIKRIE